MAKNPRNRQETEQEDLEEEQPLSVRDAIKAAVEEHTVIDDELKDDAKEQDDSDDKSEQKIILDEEEKIKDDKTDVKDSKEKASAKASKEVEAKEKTSKELEAKEKASKEVEAKVVVPTTIPKEVQKDWAKLSSSTQQYITKSQKELSDTKAELGRKVAQYKDIDAAIAPYQGSIRQLGVTPAQTVDRLFQWMNALAGPNKYQAIQQLAQDFGIDLPALYVENSGNNQKQNGAVGQNQKTNYQDDSPQYQPVDPRLVTALESMYSEVSDLRSNHQRQRELTAEQSVSNWAGLQQDGTYKNKPYFSQVRQHMFNLLAGGSIPLVNGSLDLDAAYESACYTHPEIREQVLQERDNDKFANVEAARKQKVVENKAKVNKAKSLSVGLKPSSPSGDISEQANTRGKSNKSSVRDSIMSAIQEARN